MTHRGLSAAFAALLLLGQLSFGVAANAMPCESGAAHCSGCPTADMTMHGGDPGSGHCPAPGTSTHSAPGCGNDCSMLAGGACGFVATSALSGATFVAPLLRDSTWRDDARATLPDSPLFEFLRPPN